MPQPTPQPAPQPDPQPAPVQEPAAESETTEEIAHEIEQNLSRMMDVNLPEMNNAAPGAKPAAHTDSSTIKFTNLQFGRNYDPTSGT